MQPSQPSGPAVVGLVLAAGAGTRMGRPKALMTTDAGTPWVAIAAGTLRDAGCDPVLVVLGAAADAATALVPAWAHIVVAEDWADGMAASLRRGLEAAAGPAAGPAPVAALVTLVDLPDASSAAAGRVLAAGGAATAVDALARAAYRGRPGHPVLIGRAHWAPLLAALAGDVGARTYLTANGALEVECGDLGDGRDVDTQPAS